MRNHTKAADKELSKSPKSDARPKSMRKPTTDSNVLLKKMKSKQLSEAFEDSVEEMQPLIGVSAAAAAMNNQECIFLDVGSKKSYIDLTESRAEIDSSSYSRISVIRSVGAKTHDDASHFGFYQEKPVDFSPKNKHHASSSSENANNHHSPSNDDANNLVEISRQCATMMVM